MPKLITFLKTHPYQLFFASVIALSSFAGIGIATYLLIACFTIIPLLFFQASLRINQKILLPLYLYDPESDHPGPILLYKDPLWVFPNHNYDFTAKTWWVDD